ncbi:putative diguanylate cyclase DgcQ [bioreactor metagenome]|uniref:Putative diguanylate cyclase DgcQ n=1 Tax=bioreactor metagenome TaxID=1076179 RepID=A0A645I187_9ZZZZ
MSVLACDIDHFKRINDAWGHERGDMVLQLVSSTLKNNLREHDLVARLGGEEFVLLLADITLREAELIAQRIQRDLGSKNTVLPTGPKLTMSFGISSITKPSQFEQAMKEADQLLYQAKNAGRDRVHVSGVFYPDISVDIHQQWNRPAI